MNTWVWKIKNNDNTAISVEQGKKKTLSNYE